MARIILTIDTDGAEEPPTWGAIRKLLIGNTPNSDRLPVSEGLSAPIMVETRWGKYRLDVIK